MKNFIYILFAALFIISCEKEEKNPKVSTTSAAAVSAYTCKATATIDERGSYTITDHGFICYYGTSESIPYMPDSSKLSLGKTLTADTFKATFALRSSGYYYGSGYKYYVRAYITNEKGIVYGNAISFAPVILSLSSVSVTSAKAGDTIVIYGNNFDLTPSNNVVKFYNYNSTTAKVVSATKTELRVIVPSLTDTYNYISYYDIIVSTGGQSVTLYDVFSPSFSVISFSPSNGTFGTTISIYGTNLSQISGVMLGNTAVTYYTSSGYVYFYVPSNFSIKKSKIYVTKNGVKTEVPGGEFTMNSLTATSFSPTKITTGNTLTIYGSNFNSYPYNTIFIGSAKITPGSSYTSSLSCNIPSSLASGDYKVSVSNGLDTVALSGTLKIVSPSITGISPSSGYPGTDLVISGHNLNTGYSYVYFNNYNSTSSYYTDSTTYKVKVPSITPGTYKVSLSNGSSQYYSPTDFTVLEPKLTSVTPSSGAAGNAFVITGEGFGTSSYNVYVKFGSTYATIVGVNNTQINGIVPSSLGKGTWMVTISVNGYTLANSLTFTIP